MDKRAIVFKYKDSNLKVIKGKVEVLASAYGGNIYRVYYEEDKFISLRDEPGILVPGSTCSKWYYWNGRKDQEDTYTLEFLKDIENYTKKKYKYALKDIERYEKRIEKLQELICIREIKHEKYEK